MKTGDPHIDLPQFTLPGMQWSAPGNTPQEHHMLDIVMLALGLGFFALAVGYTYACERL